MDTHKKRFSASLGHHAHVLSLCVISWCKNYVPKAFADDATR